MDVGLLGPLTVTIGDRPVVIEAGRQRTVLAMLALHAGRLMRTTDLVDALWGDDPPATGVKTTQTYVARLRRVLPEGSIASAAGGYQLSVPPEAVDAWRFEQAILRGRGAVRAFDHQIAITTFEEALELWRGEPSDLGEQPRGVAASARLRELRLAAEEELAETRLAIGRGGDLVPDLESAVRAEPLRERRWSQLMLALYRGGRQAEALRAYQRARRALVDGLGIEPGPELRAMERAVIDRSPSLLPSGPGAPLKAVPPLLPAPSELEAIASRPFVGRSAELERFAQRWHEVRQGRCGVVVMCGEPGIGTTRLAGEAAMRAHRDGALVLFGRCEPEPLTPYQAIIDALRPLVRRAGADAIAALPAWQADEVARLVPEIGDRLGHEAGPILDEAGARHRLFEAIAAFLMRQTGDRPLVVVVDDLHWIDRGGAAALGHLVRSVPSRFLLLATHRAGDAITDGHLAEWVARLPPNVDATLLPLESLGADAVHALMQGDADEARSVHAATGGNPLLVSEVARFRAATGRLPGPDEVPLAIRHIVSRRVAMLDERARRAVEAAAVAGGRTSTTELASVLEVSDDDAVGAVEESIAAHLLCEQPGDPGAVAFTHELVRLAVLHDLSAPRRAHVHRRLATALIDGAGGQRDRAAEIVHHLVAAGARGADVARWAVAAAHHALEQAAWETAIDRLETALAHVAPDDLATRTSLHADLGRAARAAGHETKAKEHYGEAIASARAGGRAEDAGRLVMAWTEIPVDIRRGLDDVITLLRSALDDLPESDSPLRAQLMARLAFSMAWARQPGHRAVADAAIAMARRTADPVALARALSFATATRDQFEAFDPAGWAGELHGLVASLDDPVLAGQALSAWFIGCVQRGDRQQADAALHRMQRLADDHHLVETGFRVAVAGAHLALADGHVAVADRAASELLAAARRSELRNLSLFAGALLYDVRRSQGRLGELLPWFEMVHASGERIARVDAMRVEVLAAAGRIDEAAKDLALFVADLESSIAPPERPHSVATLAEVALTIGDGEAARVLVQEVRTWRGLIVYDGVNGPLEPVDDLLGRLERTVSGTGLPYVAT